MIKLLNSLKISAFLALVVSFSQPIFAINYNYKKYGRVAAEIVVAAVLKKYSYNKLAYVTTALALYDSGLCSWLLGNDNAETSVLKENEFTESNNNYHVNVNNNEQEKIIASTSEDNENNSTEEAKNNQYQQSQESSYPELHEHGNIFNDDAFPNDNDFDYIDMNNIPVCDDGLTC